MTARIVTRNDAMGHEAALGECPQQRVQSPAFRWIGGVNKNTLIAIHGLFSDSARGSEPRIVGVLLKNVKIDLGQEFCAVLGERIADYLALRM